MRRMALQISSRETSRKRDPARVITPKQDDQNEQAQIVTDNQVFVERSDIQGGSEPQERSLNNFATPPPFDMEPERRVESSLNVEDLREDSGLQRGDHINETGNSLQEIIEKEHSNEQANSNQLKPTNQSATLISEGSKLRKQDTIQIGDVTVQNQRRNDPMSHPILPDKKHGSETRNGDTKNLNSEVDINSPQMFESSRSPLSIKNLKKPHVTHPEEPAMPVGQEGASESKTVLKNEQSKSKQQKSSYLQSQSLNLIDLGSKEANEVMPETKIEMKTFQAAKPVEMKADFLSTKKKIADFLDSDSPKSGSKHLKLGEKKLSPKSGDLCLTDNQGEESSQYILEPIKNWNRRNLQMVVDRIPSSPQQKKMEQQMDQRKILEHLQNFQIIQERFKQKSITPYHLTLSESSRSRIPKNWKFTTGYFDPFKPPLSPVRDVSRGKTNPNQPTENQISNFSPDDMQRSSTINQKEQPCMESTLQNQHIDKIVITARSTPETENNFEGRSSLRESNIRTYIGSNADSKLSKLPSPDTVQVMTKAKPFQLEIKQNPLEIMKTCNQVYKKSGGKEYIQNQFQSVPTKASAKHQAKYYQALRNQQVSMSHQGVLKKIKKIEDMTLDSKIELLQQNLSGPLGNDKHYLQKFLEDPQLLDYSIQYQKGIIEQHSESKPKNYINNQALNEMLSSMKSAEARNKYKFFLSSSKNMLSMGKDPSVRSKTKIGQQTSARNIFTHIQGDPMLSPYLSPVSLNKTLRQPTQIYKQLNNADIMTISNDNQASKLSINQFNTQNLQQPRYFQNPDVQTDGFKHQLSQQSQDLQQSSSQNLRLNKFGTKTMTQDGKMHPFRMGKPPTTQAFMQNKVGFPKSGNFAKINNSADLKRELNFQKSMEAKNELRGAKPINIALPDLREPILVTKGQQKRAGKQKGGGKDRILHNQTVIEQSHPNRLVIITGSNSQPEGVELSSIKDILKIESIRELDKNFWSVATESTSNRKGMRYKIDAQTSSGGSKQNKNYPKAALLSASVDKPAAALINFENQKESSQHPSEQPTHFKGKLDPRYYKNVKKQLAQRESNRAPPAQSEEMAKQHLQRIFNQTVSPKIAQAFQQMRQVNSKQKSRGSPDGGLTLDQFSSIARNSVQRSPRTANGPSISIFSPPNHKQRVVATKECKRVSGTGQVSDPFQNDTFTSGKSRPFKDGTQGELTDELDAFQDAENYFHQEGKSGEKPDEERETQMTLKEKTSDQGQGRNTIYAFIRGQADQHKKHSNFKNSGETKNSYNLDQYSHLVPQLRQNSRYSEECKLNLKSGATNETEGMAAIASKQSSWQAQMKAALEEQEASLAESFSGAEHQKMNLTQILDSSEGGTLRGENSVLNSKDSKPGHDYIVVNQQISSPNQRKKNRRLILSNRGKSLEEEHIQTFNAHKEFVSQMQPKSKREKRSNLDRSRTKKTEQKQTKILQLDTSKLQQYQLESLFGPKANFASILQNSQRDRKGQELQYESNVLIQQLSSRNSQQSNHKNQNRIVQSRRDKFKNKDLGTQFSKCHRSGERMIMTLRERSPKDVINLKDSARTSDEEVKLRVKKDTARTDELDHHKQSATLFIDINMKAGYSGETSNKVSQLQKNQQLNDKEDIQTHSRMQELQGKTSGYSQIQDEQKVHPDGNLKSMTFNYAKQTELTSMIRETPVEKTSNNESDEKKAKKSNNVTERTARFMNSSTAKYKYDHLYRTFGSQQVPNEYIINELRLLKHHINHAYSNSPRQFNHKENVLVSNMDESYDSLNSLSKKMELDIGMEREEENSSTFNLKESSLQTAFMKPKQFSPRPIKYADQQKSKREEGSLKTTTRQYPLEEGTNFGTHNASLLQALLPSQITAAVNLSRSKQTANDSLLMTQQSLDLPNEFTFSQISSAQKKQQMVEQRLRQMYFSPKRNGVELIENIEVMPSHVIPSSAEHTKREHPSPIMQASTHFGNSIEQSSLDQSVPLSNQPPQTLNQPMSAAFYGKKRLYDKNHLFIRQNPRLINGRIDNISKQITSVEMQAKNQQYPTQSSVMEQIIDQVRGNSMLNQTGLWGENLSVNTKVGSQEGKTEATEMGKQKRSPSREQSPLETRMSPKQQESRSPSKDPKPSPVNSPHKQEKTNLQLDYIHSVFDQMMQYHQAQNSPNGQAESRGPSQLTSTFQQKQREKNILKTLEKHAQQLQLQMKKEKLSQQHQVEHQFIDFEQLKIVGSSDFMSCQHLKPRKQPQQKLSSLVLKHTKGVPNNSLDQIDEQPPASNNEVGK